MPSNKSWSVYILLCSDGTLYTGCTNDLQERLRKHNKGKGARYTRSRLPVTMAYSSWVGTRSEAQKEEARLKKLTRRSKLELTKSLPG